MVSQRSIECKYSDKYGGMTDTMVGREWRIAKNADQSEGKRLMNYGYFLPLECVPVDRHIRSGGTQ